MDLYDVALAKKLAGKGGGGGAPKYTITVSLSGGTVSGDTKIEAGKTAEITLTAGTGYTLPAQNAITVTGATIDSYNQSTGKLVLKWAIYNVSVSAACIPDVYAVTTSVTNGTATGAASITVGQTATVTIKGSICYIPPETITVTGAEYTYNSASGAVVLSNPTGAVTITAVCEQGSSPYPTKGYKIKMDLDGDGTDEVYLVLNGSSALVEVLAMATPTGGSSIQFASSGQVYENNALDVYLNTTYYATLSADAKAAIVDKTFRQDSWYANTSGNPDYNGSYSSSKTAYQVSLENASFGNEISRHVYALSVQDIIDYLEVTTDMTSADSTLNMENVQAMFDITSGNIWLRSAFADTSSYAMNVNGGDGRVSNRSATYSRAARPALCIDLSQIEWSEAV